MILNTLYLISRTMGIGINKLSRSIDDPEIASCKPALEELSKFITEDRNIVNSVRDINISLCDVGYDIGGNRSYIGIAIFTGYNPDSEVVDDEYHILEKRIFSTDQDAYYLYIIIEVLGKESAKEKFKGNDIVNIDKALQCMTAMSRCMDYFLEYVCNNTTKDNMNPIIVLAKAYALHTNVFLRDMLFKITDDVNEKNYAEIFHMIDGTLFRNLGTDWILSKDITLSDKAMVFSPQIQLKQEIFDWLRAMNHPMTQEEYDDFFIKGGIYSYMRENGYKTISEYLNIGSVPFSTEALNKEWLKYI